MSITRRTILGRSAVLGLSLLAGPRQARHAAAQGGSIPLRGGVQTVPDQESGPVLSAAPSGTLFRVWNRLSSEREGGGSVLLSSSPDGLTWQALTQVRPEEKGVTAQDGSAAVNAAGEIALAYRWLRFNPRAKHIGLTRSPDGGKTWTTLPVWLDTIGKAFSPQVAWGEGRTVLVAWADERRSARLFDIFVRRSADGGATWGPEVPVTGPKSGPSDFHYAPRLLSDGKGRFWLFWTAVQNGQARIMLSRSGDDGRTWMPHQGLSGDSQSVYGTVISRHGEHLLVTFEDEPQGRRNRVYATSSRDSGATWSEPAEIDGLSPDASTIAVGPTSLLMPSGEAWAAWHDNRNGRLDVFISRSPDAGLKWDPPMRLDQDAAGTAMSRYPKVACTPDGTLAVVWEDDRGGPEAVYGRILSRGRWTQETRFGGPVEPKKPSRAPRIIGTPQNAFYVVWEVWNQSMGASPLKSLASALIRAPAP